MLPALFALAAAAACQVGLTSAGMPIPCVRSVVAGKPLVIVIGGLDGDASNSGLIRKEVVGAKGRYSLLGVPVANPEKAALQFPPAGEAYAKNTEAHYLWRWLGVHAPDLVVIVGQDPAHLAEALSGGAPANVGAIPARIVEAKPGFLTELSKGLEVRASAAHQEISRRLARTPTEVAKQLAMFYGHETGDPFYISAVGMIGRLRLGETADVERMLTPYRDSANKIREAVGGQFPGYIVFAELAGRTRNPGYIDLVRRAADLAFNPDGSPKEAMPTHNEMSDAVFMGTPILAAAGQLTGEQKYFDMALRHFRFMQKLDLRKDGLYRHSPLDEAAWGRGNAFPALGLAITLEYFPNNAELLPAYKHLIETLAGFQDADGMWREVIDVPGSYPELSATAMIATAMLKGIRHGWLPATKYRPIVDRAWTGVKTRVSSDGQLIDVCTSTGKQPNLKAYLDRTAILGRDPRGGAMALLLATELLQ